MKRTKKESLQVALFWLSVAAISVGALIQTYVWVAS